MESLFFNTPNQRYKSEQLLLSQDEHLVKTDISNGIFFYDISLKDRAKTIELKSIDYMLMIPVVKSGTLLIKNHFNDSEQVVKNNSVTIYGSSKQNFSLKAKGEIFILFIADFFLKRYLSFNANEPIDFLYGKIRQESALKQINQQPIDALSLYIIEKIIHTNSDNSMQSIRCMHRVMELIIHQFSLLDMLDENLDKDELDIALRAKNQLLNTFVEPPTIKQLARLCATNEFKLKKAFKRVYKSTIYSYIQNLRLKEANLLLKEELMSIGEIAKRVGYKHQGHFSKLFFKSFGVYPKDLRK